MNNNTQRLSLANIILSQLGGNRFIAFTGAKTLVAIEAGLMFALPARLAKDGINKFKIVLDPCDTYTLSALKVNHRACTHRVISSESGIYCDMLVEQFEFMTGLCTHF